MPMRDRYNLKKMPPGTSLFLDGFIRGLDLMHYGAPTQDLMLDSANQVPNSIVSDAYDLNKETDRIFLAFSTIVKDIFYPLIKRVYGGTYFAALPASFEIKDLGDLTSFLWRISTVRDIITADLGESFTEFSVPLEDLELYFIPYKGPGSGKASADAGPGEDTDLLDRDGGVFSGLGDYEDEDDDGDDEGLDDFFFEEYDEELYLGVYESVENAATSFCAHFSEIPADVNFVINSGNKDARIADYYDAINSWTLSHRNKLGDHAFFLGKLVTLFGLLDKAAVITLRVCGGINYLRSITDQHKHAALAKDKFKYFAYLIDSHEAGTDVELLINEAGKYLGSAVFLATDIFLNDPIYRGSYIHKKYIESGTPLKHRHAYDRFSATHESERRRFAKMALRRSIDIINQGKAI